MSTPRRVAAGRPHHSGGSIRTRLVAIVILLCGSARQRTVEHADVLVARICSDDVDSQRELV